MNDTLDPTRDYYNEFSKRYEDERRPNSADGYHAMIDDLEVEVVERFGRGKSVLECGCGTGLLLERFARFASDAQGIDLSPGMLSLARERGLNVREGSVTALPYDDASFDVTCSFKVLAHVQDIGKAMSEMARVTKRGGVILAEFYNPWSLRGLAKRLGPAGKISDATKESAVFTRFDAPWDIVRYLPTGTAVEDRWGVRVVTPIAQAVRLPVVGKWLQSAEHQLAGSAAANVAGFYVAIIRKKF